jgi:hypothetical protein
VCAVATDRERWAPLSHPSHITYAGPYGSVGVRDVRSSRTLSRSGEHYSTLVGAEELGALTYER